MVRFKFADKIPAVFKNRYVLTLSVFLIWIFLLDSNSLISRYKEMSELRKLKKDKEYYIDKIETDRQKLKELRTDNDNLEKFAREQYKMKRPDEDLYIVLTPKEDRRITRKNN